MMTTDERGVPQIWGPPSLPARDLVVGEVHVWRAELNASEHTVRRFRETLCQDELARADRFRFGHLRRRFVVGRGVLRRILGDYLSLEPQRVLFSYSSHGKPLLSHPHCNIEFNVSHSHDLMVAAICRGWPIGVDIEKEDQYFHAMDIADRFFCKRERDEIAQKDTDYALRAFFQFWTAKEAVLKATAVGLSLELSKLEIGLTPLRILAFEDPGQISPLNWHLTAFSPAEGYSGAIAVAAEPTRLEYRDFVFPDNFE
jgi:4'-phosphopantetheinyl transferase